MTNRSFAATFSRKPFAVASGSDHPTQLLTPRGSNMFERLETGRTISAHRVRYAEAVALGISPDLESAAELTFRSHVHNVTGVLPWRNRFDVELAETNAENPNF